MTIRAAFLATALFTAFGTTPTLAANAVSFDAGKSCITVLSSESDTLIFAAAYALGFKDAATGASQPIDRAEVPGVLHAIRDLCIEDPGLTFRDALIAYSGAGKTTAAEAPAAPSAAQTIAADGQALVARFLDPATDRAELTASLKPTPDDVRAIYAEPLATALIEGYEALYQPGAAIGPKAGQSEYIAIFAPLSALKAGGPALNKFPGGYDRVRAYMNVTDGADPIVGRFKFVKPGETKGMAFDGLIHVNGRWVFMPKPWRGLKQ
ncbi:MAG: hypothetical protein C0606_09195 [Hyphomicrobiales bacterium]|nr:MAG: hypothetical protein C0606_09195 [Hyphomicrobiales bacterium]